MKKLILNEELFLEGKNLERTFDQYEGKLPYEERNANRDVFNKIMLWDPTYIDGGTTTGDYGIWLLNQFIKNNIDEKDGYFEAEPDYGQWNFVGDLLNDFIEKKSNLEKKDINQYKTPTELYQVLKNVELSNRQKERKIRKDIKGAKRVGSTTNFDIYVPETYEASCALGKGSGWCTADSRTRQYYDYYKDNYGGDYYILISKDGKYKYQIHFESDQFSAAGTNPDINEPNQERMLQYPELVAQWPELRKFIEDKIFENDPPTIINQILDELEIYSISFRINYNNLINTLNIPSTIKSFLESWFVQSGSDIPSVRVFQAMSSNQDAYNEFNLLVDNVDKQHLLTIDDLQDLVYEAFQKKFPKRLRQLKDYVTRYSVSSHLTFSSYDDNSLTVQITRSELVEQLLSKFSESISSMIKEKNLEGLKESLAAYFPDDEESFMNSILFLFKEEIIWDIRRLGPVTKRYFLNNDMKLFFFEVFSDLLDVAVFKAETDLPDNYDEDDFNFGG